MERFDFQELVEQLPLVVYVDQLDEKSSPLYISPQIAELVGYSQEEWLGDADLFLNSIHRDDRERVLAEIAERNATGSTPTDLDYRLIARDGRVVWIRDEEIVVADAEGRPLVAQGYLQDVTARRQDSIRHELLVGILSLAADETPPDEIIAHAAEQLGALFGDCEVSYVERRDEGGFWIRYTTDEGKPEFWDKVEWSTDYLARIEQGPIVIEDIAREAWLDPVRHQLIERNVASSVDVPLFSNGVVAGVLWFNSTRPRKWGEREVSVLVDVAGQLAIVLASARAREQRASAEHDLRRRDAILDAVSRSAQRLLAEPNWHDAADELLERLGVAADASRAYIFEHRVRADGMPVAVPRFEWVADGIRPEIDAPLLQEVCFAENGLARHWEMFNRNEAVAGNVADFPEPERALISSLDILSIINLPIFVGHDCWGFIGFDDCVSQREWSAAETDALRTAASLVAAAIGRERADVVLREHEQKLRAVFDTALDAIFITDDDRRYIDVNPAACDYYGVAKRDLVGRRIDDFLPPHRLETVEKDWAAYLAGGPILAEWEIQPAHGGTRVAEASAHPHFLPGLHIAFFRDVTHRKRLEAELLDAQKLESLGRLAGGIAHDFNNLLTGITGYASLLLERANGDPELKRDLGEIKRAADRAAELTKQLLAFGRRQMLKPRPLDLNTVLADVGGLLQRLLGDDVELELRPAVELGIVRADPGQIEQVIVNLAVNASNAMPHGGRLSIKTRNTDDGSVELVVADTGVGMDEQTLSQIFEPFFTTRDQGVGLGLASVYGIVHQSGGNVTVESTPGAGSVFTVRLPRVLEPAAHAAPASEPEARPGSETILLVEDEDVVRELTRRVLERQGYTVLACADGEEAIHLAERDDRTIHLLLTDVVMPGLRGYEVARKVAASRPAIKILYMSGYAEEALVGRPLLESALIEKPFAVDALARRVRETLEAA